MMSDDVGKSANTTRRSWLKIGLFVSLAFNLLIVGMVAGAMWRGPGQGALAQRGPGAAAFGAPYMVALPREDRRAVLRSLRGREAQNLPDRAARRETFQEVVRLLRAQPFDQDGLRALVAQQAQISVAVQETVRRAWLDVVTDMTEEERTAYATTLEQVLARGPKRN